MADLAQILEEELEEAVEVKNKKSLHRYITLLTDNLVKKAIELPISKKPITFIKNS